MLEDVARAVRTVRSRAGEWGLKSDRIGIIGSSAGGHLASTLLTHFDSGKPDTGDPVDAVSSRPDFGILCYAVITLGAQTHSGSKQNLLGKDPDPKLVEFLSNELQVTPQTPPTFVWHTAEDKTVKVENALLFAGALAKNGVPFSLHIYPKGAHGIGLQGSGPLKSGGTLHPWTGALQDWMRGNGWLP
jgi:acetyl esterase/lipase